MKRLIFSIFVILGLALIVTVYAYIYSFGSHCDTTSCQLSSLVPTLIRAQKMVEEGIIDQPLSSKVAGFYAGFIDERGNIVITLKSKSNLIAYRDAEGMWRCQVFPPSQRQNEIANSVIQHCVRPQRGLEDGNGNDTVDSTKHRTPTHFKSE